ncbi:hemerythrin domain-containing protein [Nocardiopsis nanhaiensis]
MTDKDQTAQKDQGNQVDQTNLTKQTDLTDQRSTTGTTGTTGPDEPVEAANLADKLFEVHGWLRDQLRQVRAEAEAYLAEREATGGGRVPTGLSLQIRQHCLAFCESLHFHHTSEDTMFPHLAVGYPHLKEPIERLIEEHEAVNRIRAELEGLLADLETADPVRFLAELDRMAEELAAHLEFEEGSLIPTLSEIPFPPSAGT